MTGTGRCFSVACLAAIATLTSACTTDTGHPSTAATHPASPVTLTTDEATAAQLAAGTWSELPTPPLAPRQRASVVWDGAELLVWGGDSGAQLERLHADGAAYDPTRQRWTKLPPSPLAPRVGQTAVWTGRELVIWGGYVAESRNHQRATNDGATYDPATRRWRLLPRAPLTPRTNAVGVWTGNAVMILGGQPAIQTDKDRAEPDGALYDPSTGTWRHIDPPKAPRGHPVSWTAAISIDDHILAWSEWTSNTTTAGGVDIFGYDETTGRWRLIPASGGLPDAQDVLWTGRYAYQRGSTYNCGACPGPPVPEATARYDPAANTWTTLPPDPLMLGFADSAWTGRALVSYDSGSSYGNGSSIDIEPGDGSAYDPAANRWTRLPRGPVACSPTSDPAWTGKQLLFYCPRGDATVAGSRDALAFTPAASH
jgi:N-acetylneuraminic acid mutarotase